MDEVNEFNSQIKEENEIKEEKNEIKEDENKIDEGYKIDEAENKKIKLLGEIDNKFIEWKQGFDDFLTTVGFDEYLKNKDKNKDEDFVLGKDNYAIVLSYVKQICYLIWQNVTIEKDNFEKGAVLTNLNTNPFENCSSLEDVLANFANYLLFFVESFSEQQQIEIDKTETPLKSKLEWSSTIYSLCLYKQEKDLLSTDEEIIKVFKNIFDSWQKVIEPELNQKTK